MSQHSRRSVLQASAAAAVAAALPVAGASATTDTSKFIQPTGNCPPPLGPVSVRRGDPRYGDLVRRGQRRFVGTPDEVRVVGSTEQVVAAVQDAVRAGVRVAVRGGGHGFEGFVDDPAVRMVIDLSGMTGVYFDPARSAYVVEGGATLGEAYRRLYLGWGVTIPGGSCPTVGAGGHVAGGGYGRLCRRHGLVSDHLYAVEVVVVDRTGKARAVVATREPDDPHRDLWWAHTGAGGGNFGAVTRYWFRGLPQPPAQVLTFTVTWSWEGMGEVGFRRLAGNFGRWCERHSAPGAPEARLYSELILARRPGVHTLIGQVAGGPDAEMLLDRHIAALSAGVGVAPDRVQETLPWLTATLSGHADDGKGWRLKVKSAFHRTGLTDRQLGVAYQHLTRTGYGAAVGSLSLNTYGGAVNAVPPHATASVHRDSTMLLFYLAGWADPAEDAAHLAWIREFYRDMYADTGGVPRGAFINYPDVDLADPQWNASGRPWSELYFGANYRRLQAVKARWDPRDVFRHALSVRLR